MEPILPARSCQGGEDLANPLLRIVRTGDEHWLTVLVVLERLCGGAGVDIAEEELGDLVILVWIEARVESVGNGPLDEFADGSGRVVSRRRGAWDFRSLSAVVGRAGED